MIIEGVVIPDKKSTANDWWVYFQTLKKRFGSSQTRQIFSFTFAKNADSALRLNQEFRAKMKKEKIDITDEGLSSVVAGVSDMTSGLFSGLKSARNIGIGLVALVLVVATITVVRNPALLMPGKISR